MSYIKRMAEVVVLLIPGPQFVLRIPRHGGPYYDLTRVVEMLSACGKRLIWLMMVIIGGIFAAVVRVINLRPSKRLTRIRDPLLLHSATKIARMIRTKEVSRRTNSDTISCEYYYCFCKGVC